jgi:hypothetical protein
MRTQTHDAADTDDECLVLGRILMDQGFRDLFRHDPQRACVQLDVAISAEALERIHLRLTRLDALDLEERGTFTTRLNSFERWKQV